MLRKIIILALFCLPLVAFSKKNRKHKPQQSVAQADNIDYKTPGAPMPPLRIVTLEGKEITNETVRNDANLIIMFFNPTCEHCENMTGSLEKNIFLFKKSNIVLVAGEIMKPYLPDFIRTMKTDQYPTLQIGLDSAKLIDKCFNYSSLPQLNIYGHDRKLIRILNGITEIDSLKQYIE